MAECTRPDYNRPAIKEAIKQLGNRKKEYNIRLESSIAKYYAQQKDAQKRVREELPSDTESSSNPSSQKSQKKNRKKRRKSAEHQVPVPKLSINGANPNPHFSLSMMADSA